MAFWAIAALLTVLVLSVLVRPLFLHGKSASVSPDQGASDIDIYRDQLRSLDAEIERGAIDPTEAEASRVELSRRLLTAASREQSQLSSFSPAKWGLAVVGIIIAGSAIIYPILGTPGAPDMPLVERRAQAEMARNAMPSQAEAEEFAARNTPPQATSDRDLGLLTQLESVVIARPDDLEGLRLLAYTYMQLGQFAKGREAQQRVIEVSGADVAPQDISNLAEYMIVAAGGYISPDAVDTLVAALTVNPSDPFSLYYLGQARVQVGDTQAAVQLWQQVLADPTIPGELRRAVTDDLTALTGDIPTDQSDMIAGMVSSLEARLASEGGPVEDWAQLIRAKTVLGETIQAQAILTEARDIFATDTAALAVLNRTARDGGLVAD